MTGSLIALAIQILVSVVLIVWTRTRVRSALGSDDEIDRIHREIGALIVELDASADRNITVLEDRMNSLKEMISEADRRISLLSQERGKRQSESLVYDRSGRTPTQRPRVESKDLPETATPEAMAERQGPQPEIPFIRFSEKPVPIEEPFIDKVISLSRKGFSSDIIAAHLGATIAEVDVVVSMEREREGRTKEP
jgi:hypothetical protein